MVLFLLVAWISVCSCLLSESSTCSLLWLVDFWLKWSFEPSESLHDFRWSLGLCHGDWWLTPKEDVLGQCSPVPKATQLSMLSVYWNNFVVCQTAVTFMLTISPGTPTENKNCGHPTWRELKANQNKSWKELSLFVGPTVWLFKLVPINEICQSWLDLWFKRKGRHIFFIEAEYESCHIINDDLLGDFQVWVLR